MFVYAIYINVQKNLFYTYKINSNSIAIFKRNKKILNIDNTDILGYRSYSIKDLVEIQILKKNKNMTIPTAVILGKFTKENAEAIKKTLSSKYHSYDMNDFLFKNPK